MLDLLSSLRQLRYPREFRIKRTFWSPQILQAWQEMGSHLPSAHEKSSVVDEATYMRLLTEVTTNLWRLKQKMLQPGTEQPLEEMRSAYRSFEAAWNALMEAGIEVLDHTGSPFNSGMLLRVLAFQPTAGIAQETVIETIRPSIYYQQQNIQQGEVIVGTPELATHADT